MFARGNLKQNTYMALTVLKNPRGLQPKTCMYGEGTGLFFLLPTTSLGLGIRAQVLG